MLIESVSSLPRHPPGITRINLDGSVDRSFGDEGKVDIATEDATVTPDGEILVSGPSGPGSPDGTSDARVTRLLPDGQPDPSFGVAGSADVDFGGSDDTGQAATLAANGDILLAGSQLTAGPLGEETFPLPAIARLHPDGSLDRSFGEQGVKVLGWGGGVFEVASTPDGGIVVEFGYEEEAALWKLTSDGSLDTDFGRGGRLEVLGKREKNGSREALSVVPQLAVLPSGKLLLAATGFPNRGAHFGTGW